MKKFYFLMLDNGAKYFYHTNRCFYPGFVSVGGLQFKTWRSLGYAKRAFDGIGNRNLCLCSCECGKSAADDYEVIARAQA